MAQIKVIIADDHPIVREGLAALLGDAEDLDIVGTAANGREAIALVQSSSPDVVLIDLEMPVLDGVSAIQRIKKQHPAFRSSSSPTMLRGTSYSEGSKPARRAIYSKTLAQRK